MDNGKQTHPLSLCTGHELESTYFVTEPEVET